MVSVHYNQFIFVLFIFIIDARTENNELAISLIISNLIFMQRALFYYYYVYFYCLDFFNYRVEYVLKLSRIIFARECYAIKLNTTMRDAIYNCNNNKFE